MHDVEHAQEMNTSRNGAARPWRSSSGSTALNQLTVLQQKVGNAGVVRLLGAARRTSLAVQRCGPVPCSCSDEERAAKEGAGAVAQRSVAEPVVAQRACGSSRIGSPTGCTGSSEELSAPEQRPYRFAVNCDVLKPGEQERLSVHGSSAAVGGQVLDVHGYASSEGNPEYNANLSCARAAKAGSVLEGVGAVVAGLFSHGPVPGDRDLMRSVVIRASAPPKPPPEPTECVPQPGVPNSDCGKYAIENSWLPEAYAHNATCACQETPNEPTANCVRKFLQDRLGQVDGALKLKAAHYKGALMTRHISIDEYINFVQLELTPVIYKDHVDAYSQCCCPSGPASLPAWRGVTTVPLPCSTVGDAIRQYGSCHGTPGKW
jgi:outer membrane protein OmpA-like peptidoglycan-associated protein